MPDPEILKIGKYEVQAELGQGGFGKVYRAFDPTVGRSVAIKILTTEGNRDLLTRFRNEASAAGKLKHKNIVTIHEFGEHNGRPFLVMELLEGQDLLQIIKDGVPLTLLQKMNIMDQVAEGLDCAHGNGVIHRDIKPANIRLLPDGTVKIMDFGVARMNRDRNETGLTQQGDLIGTILYMSPEQFAGGVADVLSDIFAYGVTYYELLTGKHPFKENDPARVMFKISMEDPAPLRSLVPECPEGLEEIISRALQKDRELRYQGLRDLRLDTEPLLFELEQDRARALVIEAQKKSDAGEFANALSIIHEAMNLDPGNRDVRQLREAVQRELQKQAIESRVKTMLQTAEEHLARREFAPAIQTLELALKLDQTNLNAREQLEAARADMQRYKDAARLAAAAQQDLRKAEFATAAEKSAEAARLDPANTEAQRILAEARQQLAIHKRLQEIDALRAKGDIDSCVRELKNLADLHPDSREVSRVLKEAISLQSVEERVRAALAEGEQRIHESHFGDAIDRLAIALNEFPKEPRILALLSQAKEGLRALGRAQEIEKAVRTAESKRNAGDFTGSLQEIDGALFRFPNDVKLAELRAAVRVAKSVWERDLAVQKTVEQCNQLRAGHQLAQALEMLQAALLKYEQEPALARLEQEVREQWNLEQRSDAARRSAEDGQRLLDQGRTAQAVQAIEKALGQYPEASELQKLLAQAQQRRDAVEQVAREAQSRTEQRDFQQASQVLGKALASWPKENRLEELQKRNEAARGAWENAQAVEAVAREGGRLRATHQLAQALAVIAAGLKKYGQEPALVALEREILGEERELEQRAETVRLSAEDGQRLLDQGQTGLAVEAIEKALGQYPEASGLQKLLAQLQQRREAVEQAALEAQSCTEQRDFPQALQILEKALESWPREKRLEELQRSTGAARTAWEREQAVEAVARECGQLRASHHLDQALKVVETGLNKYGQEPAFVALEREIRGEQRELDQRAAAVRLSAEEGQRLLDQGHFQEAVDLLEKACDRYPEEIDLQTALGLAREELRAQQRRESIAQAALESQGWAEQKDFVRALEILDKALHSWPAEIRLVELHQKTTARRATWERERAVDEVLRECNLLRTSHRLAEALEKIQAGLKKFEHQPALVTLEKEVREQWEREQRAEAVMRSAVEGQRLLDDGRFQQAVQALQKACEQYRGESHLQTLLSRANDKLRAQQRRDALEQAADEAQKWAKKNDFKRALQILEKALESWPGEGRLEELLQATKTARAAREREQAVEAVVRKCNQLRTNHQLAEALEAIQAAQAKYEREPALVALESEVREQWELQQRAEAVKRNVEEGQRLLTEGQTALAVEWLEKACGQYGDDTELRALLSRAQQEREAVQQAAIEAEGLVQQQDFGRAIEILGQALHSWPGERRLVALLQTVNAAKTASERKHLDRQRQAEAIRRDAEEGQRLLGEGRFQQALELLERACGREPEAVELQTLFNRARVELAAQTRRQAVEQAAQEVESCAAQQDFKRALQILEKALQSWPGDSRLEGLLQATNAARAATERQQAVDAVLRECNQLVANRSLAKAQKAIRAGLLKYPQEPALVQLQQSLLVQSQSEERERPEQSATPVVAASLPTVLRSHPGLFGIGFVALLVAAFFVPRLFRVSRGVALALTSNIDGAAVAVGGQSCVLPNCSLTLPAGAYTLTATKDGFKTLSQTVSLSKGGPELKIPLVFEALPQLVQVNTNFASGRVFLDGRPAEELRDGQFTLSGVSPGAHTLRITSGDAQFETEWRNTIGASPELQRPISAKNVQATVIANVGEKGSISCDCDVRTIKVDGNAVASANSGAQAVQVTDLKEGARRISIGDRSLVFDVKPNPSLSVFLALDRDVGTLVIETGLDGAKVYINGHPYHRLTEHGLVRIPTDIGRYEIRVEKDGFRPAPPQTVELAKSEEKQVTFVLPQVPPALEIAGALAGVQVKVDGRVVGETGSNGSFRTEVSVGNHLIELSKQDYADAHFTSEFATGRTMRPSPSQLAMTRSAKPSPPPPVATAEPKPTDAQDWERVRNSNSPDELDDFIRKHPGGAFTEEARNRLAQLRAQVDAAAARQREQAAWNGIDKNNKAALQDFLSHYGAGPHAQDARGLIAGIEKQEAEAILAAQRLKEQKPKEPDQAPAASADYQSVERTLSGYEAAYNAKDFKAVQSVWQNMPKNMADATRRQFGDAKAISFQIRPLERPTIKGDSATVNCTRTLSLTTKNGQSQTMGGERVRVTLGRAGIGWLIRSITPY